MVTEIKEQQLARRQKHKIGLAGSRHWRPSAPAAQEPTKASFHYYGLSDRYSDFRLPKDCNATTGANIGSWSSAGGHFGEGFATQLLVGF